MGLDVYAVRPDQSQLPDMTAFLRLDEGERERVGWLPPSERGPFREISRDFATGGLALPADGDPTGFRGKVYEPWVLQEFGFSLYEPFDPRDVQALLADLDEWLPKAEREQVAMPLFGESGDAHALDRVRAFVDFVRASDQQKLWLRPDF